MYFIFDFDGTICDSFDITLQILNSYLKRMHKPPLDSQKLRWDGIEATIKNYKLNKVQLFLYVLQGRRELAKYISKLKTFEGLPQVLQKLAEDNTLGIISTNSKKNIEKFLAANNLSEYFKFIHTSRLIFEKSKRIQTIKQHYKLSSKNIYYIGDEVRDIQAAKKAGAQSISVTWGFENKELLKKFSPVFLIDHPQELLLLGTQPVR